jgi:hypothetical protein
MDCEAQGIIKMDFICIVKFAMDLLKQFLCFLFKLNKTKKQYWYRTSEEIIIIKNRKFATISGLLDNSEGLKTNCYMRPFNQFAGSRGIILQLNSSRSVT